MTEQTDSLPVEEPEPQSDPAGFAAGAAHNATVKVEENN